MPGIPVLKQQLHTERDNTATYGAVDHRVDPTVCTHTRFFDLDFPPTRGLCLDCGSMIVLGTWEVVTDQPVAPDAHLQSERTRYNNFWGASIAASRPFWKQPVTDNSPPPRPIHRGPVVNGRINPARVSLTGEGNE